MFHGQWYSIKSKPAQGWYYYMLVPLLLNENKTEIIWIFSYLQFWIQSKKILVKLRKISFSGKI